MQRITTQLVGILVVLLVGVPPFVKCGCRIQNPRDPCETVCQWNATRKNYDCNLRAIVILPKMAEVEASLSRVINFLYICWMYKYFCIFSTRHKFVDFSLARFQRVFKQLECMNIFCDMASTYHRVMWSSFLRKPKQKLSSPQKPNKPPSDSLQFYVYTPDDDDTSTTLPNVCVCVVCVY